MSLLLQCSRCSRDMHSSGFGGLCPQCLFSTTTSRLPTGEKSRPAQGGDRIEPGAHIGSGGRFLLLQKIGEGGMGEVWLADDQQLSSPDLPHLVALKFLSESIRDNKQALRSLKAEVLRTQSLNHPNIVRIHDLHTSEGGMPFIKMEYIEGDNLSTYLHKAEGGVMDWRLVVQVARQLASALHYAHDSVGVLHRDLKPSNLLLAKGPAVKLTDFGIAGILHGQQDEHALETQALGTLWYSSPRQAMGETPTAADDIYSFGATLYELVTGSPPFEGDTTDEILEKIHSEIPEAIPNRLKARGRRNEVPHKLLTLIHRCLDKEPMNRPPARDIINLLPASEAGAVLSPPVGGATPEPGEDPAEPTATPSPWPGILLTIAFVVAASILLAVWIKRRSTVRDEDPGSGKPKQTNLSPRTDIISLLTDPPPPPTSETQPEPDTTPLEVEIKDNGTNEEYTYQLVDGERLVAKGSSKSKRFAVNVKPGTYRLFVTKQQKQENWTQSSSVTLEKEGTAHAKFSFFPHKLVVSSTPPGAAFSWVDLDQNPPTSYPGFGTATRTDFITPGETILRSGRYRVSASKPGFLPWEQTLELSTPDYYFYLTNISLQLASRIVKGPFAAPQLTNSLNAVFIEVGAKRPPSTGFPLYACATETTVAEFREFVKKTQRPNMTGMFGLTINGYAKTERTWEAPGWEQTDRHPVVGVNWDDANAFCKWLTEVDRSKGPLGPNQVYRLPSSEEWKKIAGEAKYPWGDSSFALDIVGNYCGTEVRSAGVWPAQWPCIEGRNDGYPRTAPPDAKFKAGERGFYHMGGNAAEWCQDKVLCGGSWFDGEDGNYGHRIEEYLARETVLKPASPERRDDRYGFRVVIAEE